MFAYGPADAAASQTPSSLASFKSRLVLPFWYRLTQVVLEKRLLNGCSSSSSSVVIFDHFCQINCLNVRQTDLYPVCRVDITMAAGVYTVLC